MPPEAPFNTQSILTNETLEHRTRSMIGVPPVEEVCYIGQHSTEDWLYVKGFHLLACVTGYIGFCETRCAHP